MKKIFFICCFCLLIANVWAQKNAPILNSFTYSSVQSFTIKGGKWVEPTEANGKVLSEEQETALWEGLMDVNNYRSSPSRCEFNPHDGFYFYDEDGAAVAKVIVCFECGDVFMDFNISEVADKSNLSSNEKMFVGMSAAGNKFFHDLIAQINGQVAHTYIVKTGDYLYKIAKEYGTTVEVLMEINGLENDRLDIGQVLILPSE